MSHPAQSALLEARTQYPVARVPQPGRNLLSFAPICRAEAALAQPCDFSSRARAHDMLEELVRIGCLRHERFSGWKVDLLPGAHIVFGEAANQSKRFDPSIRISQFSLARDPAIDTRHAPRFSASRCQVPATISLHS
jgi:hypothetical protein